MRASREIMAQRHIEIVWQTAKLLRKRGILGTSLADLMGAAGLTHGGFYKHFDSKDALVVEATNQIFADFQKGFEERARSMGPKAAIKAYIDWYLSPSHVNSPEQGCPIASFGGDVGRERGAVKTAFTDGVKGILEYVMAGLSCPKELRHERALELMSLMSGAVSMARAFNDKKLSADTIVSAHKRATKIVDATR